LFVSPLNRDIPKFGINNLHNEVKYLDTRIDKLYKEICAYPQLLKQKRFFEAARDEMSITRQREQAMCKLYEETLRFFAIENIHIDTIIESIATTMNQLSTARQDMQEWQIKRLKHSRQLCLTVDEMGEEGEGEGSLDES
jgi:hypothetical protein